MRKEIKVPLRKIKYFGLARYCPVCSSHVRSFLPAGLVPRADAGCPLCGSLERHRLAWLFLRRQTNLWDAYPKSMLHIAPELCFHDQFTHIKGLNYVSGDVEHRKGIAVQMDITALPCPSKFFDVIYCSHVLEHVPDDRRALREFRRVLKPGGWALLHIPVLIDGPTFEDPGITDLRERERLFGQFDHVRRYGVDFSDRLIEAGLKARFVTAKQVASEKERKRMGIPEWEGFWFSVVPNEGLRS